jgi:phosphate acetyltransferase
MNILNSIYKKAASNPKRIVLPEALDTRVIQAVGKIAQEKLALPVLVGNKTEILKAFKEHSVAIDNIEIIENKQAANFDEFAAFYYENRKHRGMTIDTAREIMQDPLFYSAMLVAQGEADGFVAGAVTTSGKVAQSALHCIGVDDEIKTLSSSFIMMVPDCILGEKGVFVFADCGIVPDPTSEQLAAIAVSSAELLERVFDIEPRVALLSYSTKGSGKGAAVDKVSKAVEIAKKMRPNLILDGEIQADAAIVPEVSELKSPESCLEGRANVLVFPGLEAGNISYKLVQRLSKAKAIGPLLQGLKKSCSDLSRGCSVEAIIDAVAITAVRNQ